MNCTNQIQEVKNYSIPELTDMLKRKVLCETESLLHSLQRGYRLDTQFILSEIKLIDMLKNNRLDENFSLYALQFYLNNLWETS
jgi:hypothetical protein|nr:MAG TPA: hypothetical protein [Caudoviricetes sp.]